jgi:hypothetical protein
VVGLLTYAVDRWATCAISCSDSRSIWALISRFGLDLLVNLFVNAVRNSSWPSSGPHTAGGDPQQPHRLWLLVAYAGYWGGARLALYRFRPEAAAL